MWGRAAPPTLQLQGRLGLPAAFLCRPGGWELTWGKSGTYADSPDQMVQLSNIIQCLKEQRHSSDRAEDLRNRSQSLQDPTGLNIKAEDRGGQLPPGLGLWAPACSPLDASSHSCLTLYRTWAFGWLSGRWQAMTAVFPSSTSITCCTSNLKSWRSVERSGGCRLGFDGGDMKCSRVSRCL